MKRITLTLFMSFVMMMFASAAFGQSACTKKSKADCEMKKKSDATEATATESTVTLNAESANAAKATADTKECEKKCAKKCSEVFTKDKQKQKAKNPVVLAATERKI